MHEKYNDPGYYAIALNGVSMSGGPGWDAGRKVYETVADGEAALRRYDRERFTDESST